MWMVYDSESRVTVLFDNREDAEKEYLETVKYIHDMTLIDLEYVGTERIILAKVEKMTSAYDTKIPVTEEDENGNAYETKDTYWDLREDIFVKVGE